MKKVFFILLLLSFYNPSESNNTENGLLVNGMLTWHPTRKLDWNDFKGLPSDGSPFSAACNWQIDYSYTYEIADGNLSIDFDVNSYFNQLNSWAKSNEKCETLLGHEQVHFDIAEVYARILRKKFNEAKYTKRNFRQEVSKIFKETLKECHKIQEAYDAETNHGLNASDQDGWAVKVYHELDGYTLYAKN